MSNSYIAESVKLDDEGNLKVITNTGEVFYFIGVHVISTKVEYDSNAVDVEEVKLQTDQQLNESFPISFDHN